MCLKKVIRAYSELVSTCRDEQVSEVARWKKKCLQFENEYNCAHKRQCISQEKQQRIEQNFLQKLMSIEHSSCSFKYRKSFVKLHSMNSQLYSTLSRPICCQLAKLCTSKHIRGVHLHQFFEKSSSTYWIFCLFRTRFLQATQAVKIQFENQVEMDRGIG